MTDTTAVAERPPEDMELRTKQFIVVRDTIKQMDDAHKETMKPWRELQEQLTGVIQKFMSENKLENLRTSYGTCYTLTKRTASLADPEAFMKYVIANSAFDLIDRRANSTAVQAFVKEHNALPPGCNLNSIETIGVRRASGAKDED